MNTTAALIQCITYNILAHKEKQFKRYIELYLKNEALELHVHGGNPYFLAPPTIVC